MARPRPDPLPSPPGSLRGGHLTRARPTTPFPRPSIRSSPHERPRIVRRGTERRRYRRSRRRFLLRRGAHLVQPDHRPARRRLPERLRHRMGDERDHVRVGDRRAGGGVRHRPARQGRERVRGDRSGPGHARQRRADRDPRPDPGHRRHRRRPGPHGERVHHGRDRGLGRRRPGGQARQPRRLLLVRDRRRTGAARRGPGPGAGTHRPAGGEGRDHLLLRPAVPPLPALRGQAPP